MAFRLRGLPAAAFALLLFAATATADAAQSDREAIRAIRIQNNAAIASHDVALMRKAWAPNIVLIAGDGSLFSGAAALARSYAAIEFKDRRFIAYVRRPSAINMSADGKHAAEYGNWTAINKPPSRVRSGTYLASWAKTADGWKIQSEQYVSLGLAPQSVSDVLRPVATLRLGGSPDWIAASRDAVWIANDALKEVQRVDLRTSTVVARVPVPGEPCSGLTFAFGTLWVPLCGAHPALARVDPTSNAIRNVLPIRPGLSEGGITASSDSVWMATRNGTLARIDPVTNRIRQKISLPPGSYNALFSEGTVWVTSGSANLLTGVDAATGKVVARIPTGAGPRFLTASPGVIWTLDQGDGSITKVDITTRRAVARIDAQMPGGGGEITYGDGAVWATIIGVPLARVDVKNNSVQRWGGRGGDAVRFIGGALWLTDYFNGLLWRITPPVSSGRR